MAKFAFGENLKEKISKTDNVAEQLNSIGLGRIEPVKTEEEAILKNLEEQSLPDDTEKTFYLTEDVYNKIEITKITHGLWNRIDFDDFFYQDRLARDRDSLETDDLKESIKLLGVINRIVLQDKGNGRYRIIMGFRRSNAVDDLIKSGIVPKGDVVIYPYEMDEIYLRKVSFDDNNIRKQLHRLEISIGVYETIEKFGKAIAMKIHGIKDDGHLRQMVSIAKNLKAFGVDIKEVNWGVKKTQKILSISKITAMQEIEMYKDLPRENLVKILIEMNCTKEQSYLEGLSKDTLLIELENQIIKNVMAQQKEQNLSLSDLVKKEKVLKGDMKNKVEIKGSKMDVSLKVYKPTDTEKIVLFEFSRALKSGLNLSDADLLLKIMKNLNNLSSEKISEIISIIESLDTDKINTGDIIRELKDTGL